MPPIANLKQRFALIDGLQQAGTSLSWDQDTPMPPEEAAHTTLDLDGRKVTLGLVRRSA